MTNKENMPTNKKMTNTNKEMSKEPDHKDILQNILDRNIGMDFSCRTCQAENKEIWTIGDLIYHIIDHLTDEESQIVSRVFLR
jgi:hypothetical protein